MQHLPDDLERFLALRAMHRLAAIDAVTRLPNLRYLWLDGLTIDHIPDLSACTQLQLVVLTEMRNLHDTTALHSLARATHLEQALITESRLPAQAFQPLADHPTLTRVGVGLGGARRNRRRRQDPRPHPTTVRADLRRRTPPAMAA